MRTREITYPAASVTPYSRVSWGAVFAGAFTTSAAFLSLMMLGAGIGLAAAPGASAQGLGIGAGIYGFLSALIAFYCGGWIAGRLSAYGHVADSVIHGVVCWSVTVLMGATLFGAVLGKTFTGLAGAAGGAAKQTAMSAQQQAGGSPSGTIDRLESQARELRRELDARVGRDDPDRTNVSRQDARETAENVSQAAGAVGLAGGLLMLLELLACAFGARAGTRVYRFANSSMATEREREIAGV